MGRWAGELDCSPCWQVMSARNESLGECERKKKPVHQVDSSHHGLTPPDRASLPSRLTHESRWIVVRDTGDARTVTTLTSSPKRDVDRDRDRERTYDFEDTRYDDGARMERIASASDSSQVIARVRERRSPLSRR